MFRGLKALGLSVVFGVGCVQSALNPGDRVELTGLAQEEDKTPIASSELNLERSANSACVGIAPYRKPKTDAQGAFREELTGADTQNGENARCFLLSLPVGAQGARVSADFLIQVTDPKVPTLQRWNGGVSASATATGAELKFNTAAATHGLDGLGYSATVANASGIAWRQDRATSPVAFSDYILEDFGATAYVSTANPVKGSGTTFSVRYQSDAVNLASRSKVPVSRGASCAYNEAPTLCPLTDGKVTSVKFLNGIPELKVTLPAAKLLVKAVLRGVQVSEAATVLLEGSADGVTWRTLGSVGTSDEYQQLELAAGTAVSQVRIKGTPSGSGTFTIRSLDELSLFE